ncbi:hypothetical protein [Bauldia sp.]|uniref:hypothetical protein n=1 Tax=Bauldia sp. TaxID=2575872 RepID=UPI003BAB46F0
MDAMLHSIEGRWRFVDADYSRLAHFERGPGTPVPAGIVVDQPGWSLYCLDMETRQAVFVETDADIDLADAPFFYSKQFEAARRVALVPFAALGTLAAAVPAPDRLAFIFNTGRCGTTLVNAMLNRVEGVWSLSEPDALFDLAMARDTLDPAEHRDLLEASTRLLFRPPSARAVHTLVIKPRSQSLFHADLAHAAFPDASLVFMYRDGVGWARSFFQMATKLGFDPDFDEENRRFSWWILSGGTDPSYLRPYLDFDAEIVRVDALLAPVFGLYMETYLRHVRAGVPFLAIRYNELNADRDAVTARLLRHCGLPETALPAALSGFESDSQAGTAIGRDRQGAAFGAAERDRFLSVLAHHPQAGWVDALLPDIDHPERRDQPLELAASR